MSRSVVQFASVSTLAFLLGIVVARGQSNTVIFQDDFNSGSLDTAAWGVATHTLGRTQLGYTPTFGTDADGTQYATLNFDTYNPSAPGRTFMATEIRTHQAFAREQGMIFEARVRCRKIISGQVCAFFTYFYQDPYTDEIDFEFLTKQLANSVLCTAWNDWDYRTDDYTNQMYYSSEQIYGNFDRANWNIIEVVWLPDYMEWYVNGVFVRAVSTAVADANMNLHLNFWAPNQYWTDAYNANLKPTNRKNKNVRYYFDVDYVRVSRIGS